jgi:hypothetical protein
MPVLGFAQISLSFILLWTTPLRRKEGEKKRRKTDKNQERIESGKQEPVDQR